MKTPKKVVEVFVEKHCPSCEEVVNVIDTYRNHPSVEVRIYDRETDVAAFQDRRVMICPATFVDHRLIFYGAFTLNELAPYLT